MPPMSLAVGETGKIEVPDELATVDQISHRISKDGSMLSVTLEEMAEVEEQFQAVHWSETPGFDWGWDVQAFEASAGGPQGEAGQPPGGGYWAFMPEEGGDGGATGMGQGALVQGESVDEFGNDVNRTAKAAEWWARYWWLRQQQQQQRQWQQQQQEWEQQQRRQQQQQQQQQNAKQEEEEEEERQRQPVKQEQQEQQQQQDEAQRIEADEIAAAMGDAVEEALAKEVDIEVTL